MSGSLTTLVMNTASLGDVAQWPQQQKVAVARALNAAADWTRRDARKKMEQDIAFPAGYLAPSQGNLYARLTATPTNLVSMLAARARNTSLSRFVTAGTLGKPGIVVSVKRGRSVELPQAFFIKLRAGAGPVENKFNMGVAVRLRPGQTLRDKRIQAVPWRGLYILYGPSVDQVFRVYRDESMAQASDYMQAETLRQLGVLGL